ncbi:Crp/Fnr family transcriptional regulator [Butyricicoccus sp. Marseille-Q5471]|uniref:Crp/Fnr family transcriptional regulator n=1 Tax=Butyricicoccus sp. Marseille-Q5471 TaxID=3039493 RepID=UPI0024BCD13E|nr:Crp/Fnr family transcriptional regulator [Butyricicoccus sp. Marseille-Q5471]
MELSDFLPFWSRLTEEQRMILCDAAQVRRFEKGRVVHRGSEDCVGLLLILHGRLRAYVLSDEGKELTLYRLLERDICLFSASCMMRSIEFEVMVEAEADTEVIHLPAEVFRRVTEQSAPAANYVNELMATRFSDVMWLMDQVLSKKMDGRLAALLLEECELAGSDTLSVTHEQLARHLGSAREVVTRMLKYFQNEGLVHLTRGSIALLDRERLSALAADSLR